MRQEFLDFYRKLNDCRGTLLLQAQELTRLMSEDPELNEQGDRVYALRECEKICDDLLKEIRKMFDAQQKLACLVEMKSLQDGSSTPYHTGKAAEEKILVIPQKRRYNPQAFDKLMEDLGIPAEVYMAELVRPNWPEVQKYYNAQLEQGRNLPIEVTDGFIYKYPVRKRKSLDAD